MMWLSIGEVEPSWIPTKSHLWVMSVEWCQWVDLW